MIDLEDLTFAYKGKIGKRRCYRVYHKDLLVIVYLSQKEKKLFSVKDLNTYGVAFIAEKNKDKEKFYKDQVLYLSIIFKRKIILRNLKARVIRVHHDKNIVACEFLELTRKQEYTLDELCLLIQKELLTYKKKEKK